MTSSPWKWRRAAVWVGLLAIALAIRLPFVLRVGPNEGGGDEWYAAWRSWCVLFDRGNPCNFLHPALFYEAGAALFAGLYFVGEQSGTFHAITDLLTDFVLHEAKYVEALQVLACVFGAATVPVVFELGRRVSGWRAGAIAAAILATLPLHVLYSQRARVDSLCVLLTALSALALHQLFERGRRRDFIVSGVLIGLATAANYPAAYLGVAYLAVAIVAQTRSSFSGFLWSLGLGVLAAVLAFGVTNPYMFLTPAAAWHGFTFQLSLAVREHPYTEQTSRWFYVGLLRDQGALFAILAACAGLWLTLRGDGFRRILGLFPWLFVGTFMAASTQIDRYILIAVPWFCAAIGVLLGDASSTVHVVPRRTRIATASLLLAALMLFELWRQARPFVLVGNAEEHPRWVLQRWLIQHAPPGATVWLESDLLPLLQATFADPGGGLQVLVQQAFRNAHPTFRVHFMKGALVEGTANFDPTLITQHEVDMAVSCDRNLRYVESFRPEYASQRAFYAALSERGVRRFETMGCWIAEIS